jgi:hypothetical protein
MTGNAHPGQLVSTEVKPLASSSGAAAFLFVPRCSLPFFSRFSLKACRLCDPARKRQGADRKPGEPAFSDLSAHLAQ